MRIAVIGAGIGGLTLANGLQRAGVDVSVFERAYEPPMSGSGLSVFGNGWRALDAVGVGDAVREIAGSAVTGLQAGQRTPNGSWLARTPMRALTALRIVHRAELHAVLEAQLRPGTVLYAHAAHVSGTDGLLALEAPGGNTVQRFPVVVGADGIRSATRSAMGLDTGVRYAGYSTWRGITSSPVDLHGAAGETWGRGLRFGYAPLQDGRVYWFAVATMPAQADVEDELGHVRARFTGWHDPIAALLEATDPAGVFRLPIEDLDRPLSAFHRGRCVLLGDAAHAMTPDLGQGGNQAMEDAADLTARLHAQLADGSADPDGVAAALDGYDRARRVRTQAVAARARSVGRVAQAGGPVSASLRNALLRATPSAALARQLDELQSWTPPTTHTQERSA